MLGRLQFSPLFSGFTQSSIERLLSDAQYNTVNFPKGTLIVSRGERCDKLIIILKGKIRAEILEENGSSLQVEVLKAPQILAPAFIFGNRPFYPVNATALEETSLMIIPKESLLRLISSDVRLLTNYLNILSNKTQFLTERIRLFSLKTIRQKIASYFLERFNDDTGTIKQDRTQQDMADFFGVSRPALARVLGELKEEGIIDNINTKTLRGNKEKLRKLL